MAAAVILPAWSQWATVYLPLGRPATVRVGLWEYCSEVETPDNLRLCRNINTTVWPLWDSNNCITYFNITRGTAIAAASLGFLAFFATLAATRLTRGPAYHRRIRRLLLAVVAITLLVLPAAVLAFAFWIVLASQTCGSQPTMNGTDWPYPTPPQQLGGYGTSFILAVVSAGLALAALCLTLLACLRVSRDLKGPRPPRPIKTPPGSPREVEAEVEAEVVPYVVPYLPSVQSVSLIPEKSVPDLPPQFDEDEPSSGQPPRLAVQAAPLAFSAPLRAPPQQPQAQPTLEFPQHRFTAAPVPQPVAPPVAFVFPQSAVTYSAPSFGAFAEPPMYTAAPVTSPTLAFHFPGWGMVGV
eukprot:EG_transcript_14467